MVGLARTCPEINAWIYHMAGPLYFIDFIEFRMKNVGANRVKTLYISPAIYLAPCE